MDNAEALERAAERLDRFDDWDRWLMLTPGALLRLFARKLRDGETWLAIDGKDDEYRGKQLPSQERPATAGESSNDK